MTTTRWYPFREVAFLQNRQPAAAGFVPPVDVYEDEQKIVLKLEVPGIKQDDLDIRLENNSLTIRGERKIETEEKRENFRCVERSYGSFSRAFTLPTSIDSENVKASYDSGVLKLELNKRAEAKPKQIKIGVASAAPSVQTAEPVPSAA